MKSVALLKGIKSNVRMENIINLTILKDKSPLP